MLKHMKITRDSQQDQKSEHKLTPDKMPKLR